jgi:nuclear transcription factor Y, gamma
MTYWHQVVLHLENDTHDYKIHPLPLARIKKVMKADPEVKMISAEAPILFAKGCDIFITELTMRAWIHAEENKRRTLQRSDIASALTKSDMFDFLIDIVPREEATSHTRKSGGQGGSNPPANQGPPASAQLPGTHNNVQHAPHPHPPHVLGQTDYAMGHGQMAQEQEFRQPAAMYAPPVPSDPGSAYGQPQQQMFGDVYGYSSMAPQPVSARWMPRAPSDGTPVMYIC